MTRRRALALGAARARSGRARLARRRGDRRRSKNSNVQTPTLSSTLVYRQSRGRLRNGHVETVIAMPKPFHVVFPEGFTRAQMADRVAASRRSLRGRRRARRSCPSGPISRRPRPRVPACFQTKAQSDRGFPLSATYEFFRQTTSARARERAARRLLRELAAARPRYARSKHLTPYDVLIIASMVEKETLSPGRAPARLRP